MLSQLSQDYPDLDFSHEIVKAYFAEVVHPSFPYPELIDPEFVEAPIAIYGAACYEFNVVVTWSYLNSLSRIETWIPVDFWMNQQASLLEIRNQLTDAERVQNIEMSVAA